LLYEPLPLEEPLVLLGELVLGDALLDELLLPMLEDVPPAAPLDPDLLK
jgi:hypothetical protein